MADSAGAPDRQTLLAVPRLVGRNRELALLEEALDEGTALLVVTGEAGIGKTRLLHELLARRAESTLLGVCPPFRQPYTLGPVVDALRGLVDGVAGLSLTGLSGSLRPVFPEWAEQLPPAPEPLPDPAAARHRLLSAFAEFIDAIGVEVFVVEDAHWADETTLELLLFLQARRNQSPRIVVTYRPEDVHPESLLRRLVARGGVTRVKPGPLDAAATAELVSSMLGGETVSAEFAEFLRGHTDGLPLAIEESVRLLHDRADLVMEHGAWLRRDVAELGVPPSIRDAVLERVSRLSRAAGAVLSALAVLERECSPALVVDVAGISEEGAEGGLVEALVAGLLFEDPGGRLAFRHGLALRSVYQALGAGERRRLHRRAGETLEREPQRRVAELTRHFREAGDLERWALYAEQAADDAILSGDPRTAFGLLRELLGGRAVRGAAAARLVQRMPLYAAPGNEPLRDLVAMLREIADGELTPEERTEVSWQQARLMFHVGDFEAASAEMERTVPGLIESRPIAAAQAMMLLARPLPTSWPAAQHRTWLERAGRLVENAPDPSPEQYLAFRVDRAATLLMLGDPDGWHAARELPSEAESPGELLQRARGLANLGEAAMLWGRYDDARQWLAAAAALAEEHEHLRLRDLVGATLAHLDWLTGGWTDAAAWAASALDADEPVLRVDALLLDGLLEAVRGDHRRAEARMRGAIAVGRARGPADGSRDPSAALARLALGAGRPTEALAATDAAWRLVETKRLWLWGAEIAPLRVRALLEAGQRAEAAAAAAAFAIGTRGVGAPLVSAARGMTEAVLVRVGGDLGDAAGLFEQASAAWANLPRPYEALLALETAANCRLATSARGQAADVLREIFDDLTVLGATADADRVRRTLAGEGVRVGARVGRPGYGDQLSPRELDVVRLVVEGHTSGQIARVLGLSPRTVDKHVLSAMRKRDAHSRTALAVAAVESGDVVAPATGAASRPLTG